MLRLQARMPRIPENFAHAKINAIVCACWLDSEKDNTVARKVIWRLGSVAKL